MNINNIARNKFINKKKKTVFFLFYYSDNREIALELNLNNTLKHLCYKAYGNLNFMATYYINLEKN